MLGLWLELLLGGGSGHSAASDAGERASGRPTAETAHGLKTLSGHPFTVPNSCVLPYVQLSLFFCSRKGSANTQLRKTDKSFLRVTSERPVVARLVKHLCQNITLAELVGSAHGAAGQS